MSYHYTTTSTAARQSTTNAQGQTAPPGYHYMPDGSLMLDAEHGDRVIENFILDTSNIKQAGESRSFSVVGDAGSVFSLQVKNEDGKYYNFTTGLFQVSLTGLNNVVLGSQKYSGNIIFPTVSDADKYDVYFFAENGTNHSPYQEVRFKNNDIDINSSTGSNSKLIQKVIYQTLDVTITLSGLSPNGLVTGAFATKVITASREKGILSTNFSFTCTATSTRTYTVNRNPFSADAITSITATVSATPLIIEGEDIYPAVTDTDVVDGDFSAGTTHKIVMDNNVAGKMVVGDRVTTAVTTDTIDAEGGVSISEYDDSVDIVMDNNVATKMAVGDRVTITETGDREVITHFDNNVFVVSALNPNSDNVKEFKMARESGNNTLGIGGAIDDGATLTFSSKLNREIFTVAVLNPDTDNAKEFSMFSASGGVGVVGIRDNATLSFSNQRNHRWAFDNIHKLSTGMRQLKGTYFTTQPFIQEYLTQTTINEGMANEYKIDNVRVPGLDSLSALPVTTRNATTNVETTVQTGNVTFSEQALLTFGGGANATIFSYGEREIKRMTGYDVEFSDLSVALTAVSTTTTAAVENSTTVNITDRKGITDGISTVSGIGINPLRTNPTVSSGAGSVTGAGAIVLNLPQTLEDGITLTFDGAGTVATITGNIKVKKVGNENIAINFDLEKILTMQ